MSFGETMAPPVVSPLALPRRCRGRALFVRSEKTATRACTSNRIKDQGGIEKCPASAWSAGAGPWIGLHAAVASSMLRCIAGRFSTVPSKFAGAIGSYRNNDRNQATILPANSDTTHPSAAMMLVPSANAPAIFQRVTA